MAYGLGIDVGDRLTVWVAVERRSGAARAIASGTLPSEVCVTGTSDVVRGFVEHLGDSTPVIVGGTPYGIEALIAVVLRTAVGRAGNELGGVPVSTALVHRGLDEYRIGLLVEAARLAGLDVGSLLVLTDDEAETLAGASAADVASELRSAFGAACAVAPVEEEDPASALGQVAAGAAGATAIGATTVELTATGGAAPAAAAGAYTGSALASPGAGYAGAVFAPPSAAFSGVPMTPAESAFAGAPLPAPGPGPIGAPGSVPASGYVGSTIRQAPRLAQRVVRRRVLAIVGSVVVTVAAVAVIVVRQRDDGAAVSPSRAAAAATSLVPATTATPATVETAAPTTAAPTTITPTSTAPATTAPTTTTEVPTTTSIVVASIDPVGTWKGSSHCDSGPCAGRDNPLEYVFDTWDPQTGAYTAHGTGGGTFSGVLVDGTGTAHFASSGFVSDAVLTMSPDRTTITGTFTDSQHNVGTLSVARVDGPPPRSSS